MIGFFDEIPREIDEAAMVDGLHAAAWSCCRVLLPLVRPGMLVAATFGVIFIWNEFLVGLYIINSQDKETIPIAAVEPAYRRESDRLEHRCHGRRPDGDPDPSVRDLGPALHRARHHGWCRSLMATVTFDRVGKVYRDGTRAVA